MQGQPGVLRVGAPPSNWHNEGCVLWWMYQLSIAAKTKQNKMKHSVLTQQSLIC